MFWPRDSNAIFEGKIAQLCVLVKSTSFIVGISNFETVHFKRYIFMLCGKHFRFIGTLSTWVERGTVTVKCLARKQNKCSRRNVRSGVDRGNYEANASPIHKIKSLHSGFIIRPHLINGNEKRLQEWKVLGRWSSFISDKCKITRVQYTHHIKYHLNNHYRPFSYYRYWLGLAFNGGLFGDRGLLRSRFLITFAFEKSSRFSLGWKLGPLQYQAHEKLKHIL